MVLSASSGQIIIPTETWLHCLRVAWKEEELGSLALIIDNWLSRRDEQTIPGLETKRPRPDGSSAIGRDICLLSSSAYTRNLAMTDIEEAVMEEIGPEASRYLSVMIGTDSTPRSRLDPSVLCLCLSCTRELCSQPSSTNLQGS